MAKRKSSHPDALDEIEGSADRLAEWIHAHAVWVIGAVVLCIALGGVASLVSSRTQGAEDEAALALAEARADYRVAMGAPAGSFEVPELANPEAARGIQQEYAGRFQEVAAEHEGTVAAPLARLEAAGLLERQGDPDGARAELEEALAETPGDTRLRGVVLQRLAVAQERAGEWSAAAQSYESAGSIPSFPLRTWALTDAARCFSQAGDDAKALALLERVASESPEFPLPEHHRILLRELRARAAS